MGENLYYQYELENRLHLYIETKEKAILTATSKEMLEDIIIKLVRRLERLQDEKSS